MGVSGKVSKRNGSDKQRGEHGACEGHIAEGGTLAAWRNRLSSPLWERKPLESSESCGLIRQEGSHTNTQELSRGLPAFQDSMTLHWNGDFKSIVVKGLSLETGLEERTEFLKINRVL